MLPSRVYGRSGEGRLQPWAQRDRLAAFATSQGWRVADYYVDDGVSAKDMNRPALMKMLTEIQKGEVVLVYKLDRLTRNVADLDHILRKWEADGILFRSCTEDFNTTTAAGRLFIRLVADLAQWERENLAERTRMGMVKRAQGGEWNGGPAPFGYSSVDTGERSGQKVKRILVPNEHAPIVRELYERYVAGQGMRTLTLWLNREKGLKSSRGGKLTDATISGILKNPIYCGLMAWDWGVKNGPRNPDALLSEGKQDPVVSHELWEQAQRIRKGRQALPPRHATGSNILTGIGRCGLCGGYLKVCRSRSDYRYYRCGNYATKGTCTFTSASATGFESNFVEAVCTLADELANPDMAQALVSNYLKESQIGREHLTPEEIRRQLGQARQAISVWDKGLEEGRLDFALWQEKTVPHYLRVKDLEGQLKVVENMAQVDLAIGALLRRSRTLGRYGMLLRQRSERPWPFLSSRKSECTRIVEWK